MAGTRGGILRAARNTSGADARVFRDRRRGHQQADEPRQPAAHRARVRRELRLHRGGRLCARRGAGSRHVRRSRRAAVVRVRRRRGVPPAACDCVLVGVEIVDDAIELPSFRHPRAAAYVLGPERGVLSPAMLALCSHVVRIPTRFSINLALCGALVMYDRLITLGRFAPRPVAAGGPQEPPPLPQFGPPRLRSSRGVSRS